MITSHSFVHGDFDTAWYKRWAKELKQDKQHLEGYAFRSNKFWQNAVMVQALFERSLLERDKKALGFGVGQERLPALFAKHGVRVTATDQDFRTVKAGHWAEQELATSAHSLNKLGICDKRQFQGLVEYMPVDMTQIPAALHGKYDFLWSNCALGHLGSIPSGLDFITHSLDCLKPGGWAVHTTELNILSDKETVTGGSTVVFRLRDIYQLHTRLVRAGYEVQPFKLDMGSQAVDRRISMRPQFGNDYSKIQITGHLGTQIVLIIHKPQKPLSQRDKLKQLVRARSAYRRNKATIASYRKSDSTLKPILNSQRAGAASLTIAPMEPDASVRAPKGKSGQVRLVYENKSSYPLFGTYNRLADSKPVVLATTKPYDRTSIFKSKDWDNTNRVTSEMYVKEGKDWVLADYVLPGQVFSIMLDLHIPPRQRSGTYDEHFELVQEWSGWLDGSTVNVSVKVL